MDAAAVAQLAQALTRLAEQRPPAPVREFKPPQFNGQEDVEFFLQRFLEVAAANDWSDRAALLHLRGCLVDGATDCGRAESVAGVLANLRARYGLTARESRSRLATLRKGPQTSLQEHAMEVQRLTDLAHPNLPAEYRHTMVVDAFLNTLGNAALQRHLLAVDTPNLEAAVRAGNEFLQVRTGSGREAPVRSVVETEVQVEGTEAGVRSVASLEVLAPLLERLLSHLERLSRGARGPSFRSANSRTTCYGCGKQGHLRANCPQYQAQDQGNGQGPQQ